MRVCRERAYQPRFQGDNLEANLRLVELDAAVPVGAVAGERYPAESMGTVEL